MHRITFIHLFIPLCAASLTIPRRKESRTRQAFDQRFVLQVVRSSSKKGCLLCRRVREGKPLPPYNFPCRGRWLEEQDPVNLSGEFELISLS